MKIRTAILLPCILFAGLTGTSINALAESQINISTESKPTSNLLVYINPVFYDHPLRMLHPYLDYWHLRGPMFEKVALKVLNDHHSNAAICKTDIATNFTLALEPYMYYNPQMRVFHSDVIAKVYAGKLEPAATYTAKVQQQGELSGMAEYSLEHAYEKAMQNIVMQMQADSKLVDANNVAPQLGNNMCTLLNTLPTTRKYF